MAKETIRRLAVGGPGTLQDLKECLAPLKSAFQRSVRRRRIKKKFSEANLIFNRESSGGGVVQSLVGSRSERFRNEVRHASALEVGHTSEEGVEIFGDSSFESSCCGGHGLCLHKSIRQFAVLATVTEPNRQDHSPKNRYATK